jgi:hypothetical protein
LPTNDLGRIIKLLRFWLLVIVLLAQADELYKSAWKQINGVISMPTTVNSCYLFCIIIKKKILIETNIDWR